MSTGVTPSWQGSPPMQAATTAYSVYGHASTPALHTLAFKAEYFDTAIDGFMLGQGYRSYSPTLMRFGAADNWSPFGRGGINAYVYCTGDPVNRTDPDGHADMTGLFRKKIMFPPTRPRGGQIIQALDNQVQRTDLPVPAATHTANLTPHEQVQRFIEVATQRLQQALPAATQQQRTAPSVDATLQTRQERMARLLAAINTATVAVDGNAQVSRPPVTQAPATSLSDLSRDLRQ